MRRRFSTATILLALLFLLPACGAGSPLDSPAPLTTVRIASFGYDSTLDTLIAGYYGQYTSYRIEKVTPPPNTSNLVEWVLQQVEEGAVDVVQVDQFWPEFVAHGVLVNLNEYLRASVIDQQAYGSLLDQMRWDGALYEIPYALHPEVLIFNHDLFEGAGVSPPAGPWTWDEFRAAARALTRGEGPQRVWGVAGEAMERLVAFQLSQRTEGNSLAASEEELRASLQFVRSMITDDGSAPQVQARDWERGGFYVSPQDFRSGRAAMSTLPLNGPLSSFTREGLQWGILPVPTLDGSQQAYVLPRTYGIAATSSQPEAAWHFIRYAAGPEGAAFLASQGILPAYNTTAVREVWDRAQPTLPTSTAFLFQMEWKVWNRRTDPAAQRRSRPLVKAISDALSLARPLEAVLVEYHREVGQSGEGMP